MDLTTFSAIFSLVFGGSIVGLFTKVIKMGMEFQKLKTTLEQNEKRDEEERKENQLKFNELYNSRNKTNETLAELSTTIKLLVTNINQQFDALDKKIDTLGK